MPNLLNLLLTLWIGFATSASFAGFDPNPVTYTEDVQPILRAKCASCHSMGSHYPFADSYDETQRPSHLCPGDKVGQCMDLAVNHQILEGTRCRTVVVRPFHRESWVCLTDRESQLMTKWVVDGMLEN